MIDYKEFISSLCVTGGGVARTNSQYHCCHKNVWTSEELANVENNGNLDAPSWMPRGNTGRNAVMRRPE